jgi:hypothetical protein
MYQLSANIAPKMHILFWSYNMITHIQGKHSFIDKDSYINKYKLSGNEKNRMLIIWQNRQDENKKKHWNMRFK